MVLELLREFWPFSLLIELFYFIVLPILVFRLMARMKTVERMNEEGDLGPVSREKIPSQQPAAAMAAVESRSVRKPASSPVKDRASVKEKDLATLEEKVGGRLFQWIGIGALVLALLFFLKWSFDSGYIGPVGRTLIGYVLSAAAILAGDRLRTRYGIWSLAFTGGGALGSYIVTSVALHVYQLFPQPVAVAIYILTTFVVCLLSGYSGSIPLAVFGVVGGLITPVLVGGQGSTLSLLSYVLILDLGVLALAHVRQWRGLNTFCLIGTGAYEIYALMGPAFDRSYAFMFIAAFLAIYILIPYVYNLFKQQKSESTDILILVGNALLHFGLILGWLDETPGLRENYDAVVSLVFAVVFLLFASEVYRRNRKDTPLVLGSLGLAVLFTTLVVPFQLGGAWVPLAWSVEGAFLLWVAMMLNDIRIQRFAWLVMGAAYVWYFFVPDSIATLGGAMRSPVAYHVSGLYLFLAWTALLVALAGTGLRRTDHREQQVVPFILVGMVVLTIAFLLNLFMVSESSLTGIQRLVEAAAIIGGSYAVLVQAFRQWPALSPDERTAFSALGVGVQLLTLTYLSREFVYAVDDGWFLSGLGRPYQIVNVGLSILWALYGTATLVIGAVKRWQPLRIFSLVLLLLSMAKLALIDFFDLGTGARVIGFTVLGGLLVAASLFYQSQKDAVKSFFSSSSDQ